MFHCMNGNCSYPYLCYNSVLDVDDMGLLLEIDCIQMCKPPPTCKPKPHTFITNILRTNLIK